MTFSYTNLFRLDGKVAMVTGGAGILGSHFCRGLAEAGATVIIVDVNADAVASLESSIRLEYSDQVLGIVADVSNPTQVKSLVEEATQRFGHIDILHNNAASKGSNLDTYFAPFEEYSIDQWREIMVANVDSMFLMAQAVGKKMIERNSGGSIIQTASAYGVFGPDNRI